VNPGRADTLGVLPADDNLTEIRHTGETFLVIGRPDRLPDRYAYTFAYHPTRGMLDPDTLHSYLALFTDPAAVGHLATTMADELSLHLDCPVTVTLEALPDLGHAQRIATTATAIGHRSDRAARRDIVGCPR
jgi:hypothetical protein